MRWVAFVLFSAAFLLGVTAEPSIRVEFTDAHADKYMALEAVTGGNPHMPIGELAAKHDVDVLGKDDAAAARTPGALLLAVPAVTVPDSALVAAAQVVSAAGLVAVCWWSARIVGVPLWVGGLAAVLLARSAVMMNQYLWGNAGLWVAVMLAAAWRWLPSRRAGVLLGAATVVKLWPALIVAVLLMRSDSRRVGWWAVASAAGLTAAGLLLPGSSVAGSARSMVDGAGFAALDGNMSLAATLRVPAWVGLVAGSALAAAGSRLDLDMRMAAAVLAGLLASPVVWPHYWLAAVPVVFVVARRLGGHLNQGDRVLPVEAGVPVLSLQLHRVRSGRRGRQDEGE